MASGELTVTVNVNKELMKFAQAAAGVLSLLVHESFTTDSIPHIQEKALHALNILAHEVNFGNPGG